ncbi:MAG: sulfatase [Bacteroidia bacterium]|nr:sulfatase [Bacteroidia bacterium]
MKHSHKIIYPLGLLALQATAQAPDRPNIIVFLVDDMGWQDTSVPFHSERTKFNDTYETPNMERLEAQGMKFTQSYACAVSSPSRVSLLTGMNAARHRVTNWTLFKNQPTDRRSEVLSFPEWNVNGICQVDGIERTTAVTALPQLLKNAGYHTIHCGKAHFGAINTLGESPYHLGFEVNIAGHAGGGLASYLGEKNFGNTPDGMRKHPQAIPGLEKYHGKDIFATEALTLEAISALDRAKKLGQPFFLYMAHYAIHIPVDKDKRFFQKYIDKGLDPREAAYASLIEGMDKSLGDLLNWLETNGEAQNTIVMFMSDNGGFSNGAQWRGGELFTHNAPLRSGKGSAYEGGIRVPMIVKYPGKTAAASVCKQPVMIEDFFPSILEMAGIKKPEIRQEVDGKSFVSLLEGKKMAQRRSFFWHYPNLWDGTAPGVFPSSTILKGNMKLIYNYETGGKELYNLAVDLSETHNLANEDPVLLKKLSKELGQYLRKVKAQRPVIKATGKLAPWPDEI